jgi:hypothetical protein
MYVMGSRVCSSSVGSARRLDSVRAGNKISGTILLKLKVDSLTRVGVSEYGTQLEIEEAIDKLRSDGEGDRLVTLTTPDIPLVVIVSDLENLNSVAQGLHRALWGKPLEDILSTAHISPNQPIQYVSKQQVERLRLDHLKHRENVLLFRAEYIETFKSLTSRSHGSSRGGGVTVIGHPGVGTSAIFNQYYDVYSALGQRKDVFSILCSIAPP